MVLLRFAILTVSDTCASGEKKDESGPKLEMLVSDTSTPTGKILKGQVTCKAIVQDDEAAIVEYLTSWSDENKADVILTTGGTGFSQRDVTPEATRRVVTKLAPGISLVMLMSSLEITSMAMLSRVVCGIRSKSLIINLPGSCKGAAECFTSIASAIPHAVHLLVDDKEKITDTHNAIQHSVSSHSRDIPHTDLLELHKVAERNRESAFPMISVEKALDIIRNSVEGKEVEVVPVLEAHGRILFKDVLSNCNLPPFRASIKDGYAVLANDGKGRRKVLGGIKAGDKPTLAPLQTGTCIRINTGAPIPDEATAVVQVEDTKLISKTSDNIEEDEIEILVEPKEGQDIRPIGSDIEKGSIVLNSHTTIGSAEVGLLVACGCKEVTVSKLPSVGVLSTGDELEDFGEELRPGRVYDSNRITLITLLKENGFKPLDFGIVADNVVNMVKTITKALEKVDVLVTTGSVSMGDRDILKPVLQKYFKATIHFARVNMKPGKPTTFATCRFEDRRKYFLCLPGNPVSATVTAHLFLLPLLNEIRYYFTDPVIIKARLMSCYNLDTRPEYARTLLKWSNDDIFPAAYPTGNQISSRLLSCKGANALLMLPARTPLRQVASDGELIPAMLLGYK